MKKVLVFLLACLSSTVLFAQNHYTVVVPEGQDGSNMFFNASIVIDGETQTDTNLEFGVFSATTGECRGTKFPGRPSPFGTFVFNTAVYALTGEVLTYKVYNHETGEELTDVVFTEDYPQVAYQPNDQYGNARTPWFVYFVRSNNSYTLEIDPYEDEQGKDHYYLIASPIGAVAANAVEGLRTPSFDFYSFDQNAELEWINLRDDETYELQPGVGYLYANNTGTDLVFSGGNLITDEEMAVSLTYAEAATGLDFPDWNLVGNPFEVDATLDQPFYSMVEGAFVSNAAGAILPAMNGAFVVGSDEVNSVTFSRQAGDKAPMLALNLTNSGKLVDRAIVSFGKGRQLPKFQLFTSSKVYIPQDGQDFAVVTSDGIGSMPVNFKAEKTGSYSFTVNSENTQFNYLHLIDHLTGADVDLLATPSYSFDARISDYASRFQLVFATGNSDDNSFAFYNNGNIIISNEGSAILNIVDVLGRTISSQNINGSENVSINAKAGVYTLQLIQGEKVMTQKIVVK